MAYVYTFASSLDGKVFYVGKGETGMYGKDRVKSHLWGASGKQIKIAPVDQRIREIWQQGGKVIIRKPYNNIPESEAYRLEEILIKQYGYEQLINKEWHSCHMPKASTASLS